MDAQETPRPKKRGQPILLAIILVVASAAIILVFGMMSHCVVEGTPIDTPHGPVPVESLSPGDEVWTRDPSGLRQVGRVVATHPARASSFLEIRLDDGSTLRATARHPVSTPEGWREAGRLRQGDRVDGRDGGRTIAAVRDVRSSARVFDLEVEPNANFYASGILVHNKSSVRLSNERTASTGLKSVAAAEADYRGNDRDGNKVNDFWVGDVAGLYRNLSDKQPLKLIELSVAEADAAPLPATAGRVSFAPLSEWQPKAGYRYRVIPLDEQGKPYGEDLDGDGKKFESKDRFAFCAYPHRYEKDGKYTFIVDENNAVLRKDNGGKPVERWPAASEGWTKLD